MQTAGFITVCCYTSVTNSILPSHNLLATSRTNGTVNLFTLP